MPYLIDGHNLIGQMPDLSLADPDDERKLVELLRAFLVRTGKKGAVIFDKGQPGGGTQWSNNVLEVRFAPMPKTADDVIRERLMREKNPRGLVVVTADQALATAARRVRATVTPSADFAREMKLKPSTLRKKEANLTAEEIEAWEKEFKRRS
jgi:predicted RNA-binding protein with PIN domain